jgi:hypothetical protein
LNIFLSISFDFQFAFCQNFKYESMTNKTLNVL